MPSFKESHLTFTFPPDWIVRKFDDTAAYRSVSGHGLKGVDFLCLAPNEELWLIEVKNYRSRDERYRSVRRNPEGLAEHLGQKFADTKRLITVVRRAMEGNWWTKLKLRWYALSGGQQIASVHWFWYEAARRLTDPAKLTCLVWMETPERAENYEIATLNALDAWLEPENRLLIAETERPGPFPFTVTK